MKSALILVCLLIFSAFLVGYKAGERKSEQLIEDISAVAKAAMAQETCSQRLNNCEKELAEARYWEKEMARQRDEAISAHTRLRYETEVLLNSKTDSIRFIREKYFDAHDLNRILNERIEELETELAGKNTFTPGVLKLFLLCIFCAFAVSLIVIVYLKRRSIPEEFVDG